MSRGYASNRAGKSRQPAQILAANSAREAAWAEAQMQYSQIELEEALTIAIGATAILEARLQSFRSRGRNRRDDRASLGQVTISHHNRLTIDEATTYHQFGSAIVSTLSVQLG